MRPAPLWRRYDRLSGSDPAADVKDELRFHLETKVDDLVAQGWSPEDARNEAERQFGNILAVQRVGERIGEHMDRRRRLTEYWTDALRDLRFTLRTLRRDAGFTVVNVNNVDRQIIGVLSDVHDSNAENQPSWQMYFPMTQEGPAGVQLIVRSNMPPAALASGVLHALRELNPKQPAAEFRPIRSIVDHASSPRRFFMILVTTFAFLGLVLATLGIYGVISYSVTQRTREIGVRMALGATVAQVQHDVLSKTLGLSFAGAIAGTAGSLIVSRAIAALLFDTAPTDPFTFAAVILLLAMAALLAGYLPARRASRINPMTALRND